MHTHLLGNVGTQVDRESQGRVCSLHKVTQLFTTLKLKTERWRPKMVTCSFKLPVQETTRKTARLPMSYFPAPGYPTHSPSFNCKQALPNFTFSLRMPTNKTHSQISAQTAQLFYHAQAHHLSVKQHCNELQHNQLQSCRTYF